MPDPTSSPATDNTTIIDDLIEIWTSPSTVFARRAGSGFFLMMCLVTLLMGLLWLANQGTLQGIMDAEYARQMAVVMEQNPSVTAEQLAMGRKYADFFTSYGLFIGIPIGLFVIGCGTWMTGKILGGELGFGAALTVACYGYVPKILELLGVTIQGLLIDTEALTGRFQLSLGVGRLLDPAMQPGLLGLLARLDLFTLWVSVLLGIGITVVGKLPRSKIVPAAVIMWTVGSVASLWALLMETLRSSAG